MTASTQQPDSTRSEPRSGGALDVIAQVAAEYGLKLDGISLLLGFLVRSQWETLRPRLVPPDPEAGEDMVETLDGTALRKWLVDYFEATGRRPVTGSDRHRSGAPSE